MRFFRLQPIPRVPWLLAAALLFVLAAVVMPFDETVATVVRAFSHAVGQQHVIQELLALIRPFGKADVIVLLVLGLGWLGCRRRALQILLALALVAVLVWPFKLAVGRERPNQSNDTSFPSGDVATVAALCAPLAQVSPWAGAAVAIGTAGVAAGRIYDGRHYPGDTLAGAAFGLIAGAVAMRLCARLRRLPRRRWFAVAALALIACQSVGRPWGWAPLPFLNSFLWMWGPLVGLALVSRAAVVFGRRPDVWSDLAAGAQWRRLLLLVALATLAQYVLMTSASTLWDRDEPRFARATVEMVQSGNFLYPTFNGVLRPDKPILIYWLMSVPVRLFGSCEMTCRAVAPLAAALAALLTAWIGRRLAGPLVGILAAAFMVTAPLLIVSGTAATTDALLLACITGAVVAFLHAWQTGRRWPQAAWVALALGGALLTKGPVGLAVPMLIVAALFASTRRQAALTVRACLPWLLLAVAIGTALFLAWGLPANIATDGEFLRRGLGHHVVDRAVTPLESHGGKSLLFVFYYVPLLIVLFFPWTLYALPALGRLAAPAAGLPPRRVALAWALPVIGLMSLVATKLPHYILPAWPGLALLAGLGAAHLLETAPGRGPMSPLTVAGRWVFGAVGLTLGGGLIVAPWFVPVFGLRVPSVSTGAVMLAMTCLALRHHRRGRHVAAIIVLLTGMNLVVLTASLGLLPALESVKLSPRLAEDVRTETAPCAPVSTCGYGEPSLNFYLDRGPIEALDQAALQDWARRPGPGVLVVTQPKAVCPWEAVSSNRVRVVDEERGFNYSQGKWVEVLVMEREGLTNAAPGTEQAR